MSRSSSENLLPFNSDPERLLRNKTKKNPQAQSSNANKSRSQTSKTKHPSVQTPPPSKKFAPQKSPQKSPHTSPQTLIPPPSPKMPTLSDSSLAKAENILKGSTAPSFIAKTFKIDAGFYNIVRQHQFDGENAEDPAEHINQFCDLCQMITHEGVDSDDLRFMMFKHSLKGRALIWLREATEIKTWNDLVLAFYHKYFPRKELARLDCRSLAFARGLRNPCLMHGNALNWLSDNVHTTVLDLISLLLLFTIL